MVYWLPAATPPPLAAAADAIIPAAMEPAEIPEAVDMDDKNQTI